MTFEFGNIFSEEKECSPSLRESAPNPNPYQKRVNKQ